MTYGWPSYQVFILTVFIALCMGGMVWAIRKSAPHHFSLLRFGLGLLLALFLLAIWAYNFYYYRTATLAFTKTVFFISYASFMVALVRRRLKKKNRS